MKKAIQQIMIGPLCKTYDGTLSLLKELKKLGFDAIELNSYMIHRTPIFVRILTKLAGMPCGNAGKFDWNKLVSASNLEVASLHIDLDSLEKDSDEIIKEAKNFNTKFLIITGMYKFDYSSKTELDKLILRLNKMGERLAKNDLILLYHNHNVEFNRIDSDKFAYDYLVENLNKEYVNFEFDSYWAAEAGINIYSLMDKLGSRIKLQHINDRGFKKKGPYISPILKSNSMELGTGCIDLKRLIEIDKNMSMPSLFISSANFLVSFLNFSFRYKLNCLDSSEN